MILLYGRCCRLRRIIGDHALFGTEAVCETTDEENASEAGADSCHRCTEATTVRYHCDIDVRVKKLRGWTRSDAVQSLILAWVELHHPNHEPT